MKLLQRHFLGYATAAAMVILPSALTLSTARAQDKTYVMKITIPAINDPSHLFAKN